MGALNTYINDLQATQRPVPLFLTRHRPRLSTEFMRPSKRGSITVGRLLKSIEPGRRRALLLGECTDGLPLIIELGHPEMGAILVSGDKGAGKTHQLQVMADSAIRLNAPSQVQLGVLTFKPDEWQAWQSDPHRRRYLQGIYAWYDPWAEGWIQTLVELAEARREGKRLGADVLLVLDDLNFVEELSYEAQINLHWLLEYGAQSGVWVVGAINAHQAPDFNYWIESFCTRIIGRVICEEKAEMLVLRSSSGAKDLEFSTFRVWAGNAWRTYRLPLLGD